MQFDSTCSSRLWLQLHYSWFYNTVDRLLAELKERKSVCVSFIFKATNTII